jgi:5,10-methylenetetrahydromethanopterin reductase
MKLWMLTTSSPTRAGQTALVAEEQGFDGIAVVDSQNLSGDSYVTLTAMALATKGLGIGTGVTNPVTRHPAITASAAASIQRLSGGRMVLGIGRGDSALAHLGKAPARLTTMQRYLEVLQGYLKGEEVEFSRLNFHEQVAPDVATLGLADTPDSSCLRWINDRDTKVPVEVAVTGPRMIEMAALNADRVMFALGADLERLKWGIDLARKTAKQAGRNIQLGAYINLAAHPDRDKARKLVQGGLSTFARFSVMHGEVRGTISADQRAVLERLHDQYNMKTHTRTDSAQANVLTADFIDQYAVVGSTDECITRLKAIEALGIDKVIVIGPTAAADRDAARESQILLAKQVLPAL